MNRSPMSSAWLCGVVLVLAVSFCNAQQQQQQTAVNTLQSIDASDPRCDSPAWTRVDRTAAYKSDFTGKAIICVRSYMDVCNGATGVVACNKATSECRPVGYDYLDNVLYPNVKTVERPQVCAVTGGRFLSTVQVLIVAQVVLSFVLYIGAMIPMLIVACRSMYGGLGSVVVVMQLIVCLLLCFSFLYLSALVKLAGSFVALALFRCRRPTWTGVGCLFLVAVFFWSTFAHGMGHAVHDRLTSASIDVSFFQNQCNVFYESYFTFVPEMGSITENPRSGPILICSRYWVAAIFFFEFISELLLILLAAVGIFSLPYSKPEPAATN